MLAILFIAAFAGLLLWAAASDLATMEIPNRISVLAVALYPVAAFACGQPWQAIAIHLGVGLCAFALCWALFCLGVFGGGDAKVIAAATVWTGISQALPTFLFWTCIAGGALALTAIVVRRRFKPLDGQPSFVHRFLSERGLPYAVAIAVGGIACATELPIFRAAGI
jgi:prepilin peptidase CpaA